MQMHDVSNTIEVLGIDKDECIIIVCFSSILLKFNSDTSVLLKHNREVLKGVFCFLLLNCKLWKLFVMITSEITKQKYYLYLPNIWNSYKLVH